MDLRHRILCRIRRSQLLCTTQLNVDADTDRHIHVCLGCKTVLKDETTPLSPEMRALAEEYLHAAPVEGLPIAAQQQYMH